MKEVALKEDLVPIENELNKLFHHHQNIVNVPEGTDLTDFFATAKSNTLYRVLPNTNVLNTCNNQNTSYSFYTFDSLYVNGYDLAGNKWINKFSGNKITRWEKVSIIFNTLYEMGLNDEDFLDMDFISIISTINDATRDINLYTLIEVSNASAPNLYKAIKNQLTIDGYNYPATNDGFILKLERQTI